MPNPEITRQWFEGNDVHEVLEWDDGAVLQVVRRGVRTKIEPILPSEDADDRGGVGLRGAPSGV